MKVRTGDLWGGFVGDAHYATVITTNGDVNRQGEAVMGRGVALQAAQMWPDIKRVLGKLLSTCGNNCYVLPTLRQPKAWLVTFPVKHHWNRQADLKLIERSTRQLVALADVYGWEKVYLPRPGCGNGGLSWDAVRPIIKPLLDDRFVVVYDPKYDEAAKKSTAARKPVAKVGAVSKTMKKRMGKK